MMAENQLSDFQTKKVLRVFNILYDRNDDGVIAKDDFLIAIDKFVSVLGWPKDGDQYNKGKDTLLLIWDDLKKYADENQDDKVSKDEWVQMWSDCLQSVKHGKPFPEWQQRFMQFMFEVNDKSGDNEIDIDEYTTVWNKSYGIPVEECREAFHKISDGKNITREVFEMLWIEYFVSNERAARGNYLFGIPDFI